MPVVILDKNKSHGVLVRPSPSAPSEVKIMPPTTRGFLRRNLSAQIPRGIRNKTWGMAYAESTVPTVFRLVPLTCIYIGKMGTYK